MPTGTGSQDPRQALIEHLHWWGLRRFDTESEYYAWQRQRLGAPDLAALNRLIEDRRHTQQADEAFYDLAARSDTMPVLYSQRYDYYLTVGPLVAARMEPATTVLDFGCGVGVLTTFYARRHPDRMFIGLDRSAASLELARSKASAMALSNIRFEAHMPKEPVDLVISTQSLLQFERDPGIPSESWTTFRRPNPSPHQAAFERRTGLEPRLESLDAALSSGGGRMVLFEKARALGRRIGFQRALASRGFQLLEQPFVARYAILEEVEEDGPLYVVSRQPAGTIALAWDESVASTTGEALYRTHGTAARSVRARLPHATVRRHETLRSLGSDSIDLELGSAGLLSYLFIACGRDRTGMVVGSDVMRDALEAELNQIVAAATNPAALDAWLRSIAPEDRTDEGADQAPLYENHSVLAQTVWEALGPRTVLKSQTFSEPDGREKHIEYGEMPQLTYLYWANTFDQRQLVIVERTRAGILEQYYGELVEGGRAATGRH